MELENVSILLLGMNDEKSVPLYDILRCTGYKISSEFSIEQTIGSNELIRADCLIVDYAASSDVLSVVKNSVSAGEGTIPPVIVAGDKFDEDSIEKSFSNGVSDFIAFPFCNAEVIARVNNQIRISRVNKKIKDESEREISELKKTNLILNHSVEEYRKILQDLQENETLFLTIALNIPNSYLVIIEKDLTISFAAGQEFKKSNLDPWRLIGLPVEKVLKGQFDNVKNYFLKTFEGEEVSFEIDINNQYLLYKAVPLFNSNETVPHILVVAENITERRLSEWKIKESLQEKETLLKEIHHRVKNNMQLVCSMINLQAGCIDNREVFDIFKVLHGRIYSMSLVHEKLYHHKQFSKINFSEYVKTLVSEISKSFSGSDNQNLIRIDLELHDENFTIEKAIPCGLILNELIMNAFKHASFSDRNGFIKIVFEKLENNSYILTVSDNGKGLPEGFDINRSDSMGMTLVRELVAQLRGTVSVKSGCETVFTILFGQNPECKEMQISDPSRSSNRNILIVEDERIISRMLRKILEECGYNIIDSVASGREAIESAARNNPDLVIMDIMLEDEIDGVEAAAVIIKKNNCPIIFLTGNSDPATLKSAQDINPFEMLTKPVEKSRLISIVESALTKYTTSDLISPLYLSKRGDGGEFEKF